MLFGEEGQNFYSLKVSVCTARFNTKDTGAEFIHKAKYRVRCNSYNKEEHQTTYLSLCSL